MSKKNKPELSTMTDTKFLNLTFRRSPEVVSRKIAGEYILVPLSQGQGGESLFTLNETGARIWELLEGSLSGKDIAAALVEEFEVSDDKAEADVLEFLGQMQTAGKRVLVTGAGGSIGSELCMQISRCEPELLIALGHGENSLFMLRNKLHKRRKEDKPLEYQTVLADLRDWDRMQSVFAQFKPQIVFHAAAHKHVPLTEDNVEDSITTNVLGTRQLVDLCVSHEVERFVLISTDKAVNPVNVLGMTKRIAEMIVRDAAERTGRPFVSVRFGNVLGSRGSVVPVFQKQIETGGPVTITHPDMTRYFMTIPEAVQLVLEAAALGKNREVFVLDMGVPVRIVDLARDMIELTGRQVDEDIEIRFIGLRPGEKLEEELFMDDECPQRTSNSKIFVACANGGPVPAWLHDEIDALFALAREGEEGLARERLAQIIKRERMMVPAGSVDPGAWIN